MDKKKSTNKIKEGRRYRRHHPNEEYTERQKKITSKNEPDVENSGFDVEGKEKRKTAKK